VGSCQIKCSTKHIKKTPHWRAGCKKKKDTYLDQDHGRDFLGREGLLLAEVLNLDLGLTSIIKNGEWPGLDVLLDGGVIEAATDQTPEGLY
jgi:hypothetical protein